MKNILLPTDFSNNSFNAIKYALGLFKGKDCTFHLLNVFKIPYMPDESFSENDARELAMMDSEAYESSQKGLSEIIDKIDKETNYNFKLYSVYNSLTDSIKQFIKKEDIDLIVMGTKGATGAKEIFVGSNTGDVLEKTDTVLLVVPEDAEFKELSEITFPTDFRIPYEEKDLETLINLAKQNHSSVRILYVKDKVKIDEKQEKNKKTIESYFNKIDHTFHTVTNADFEAAISSFTKSKGNIDMIAIVARHHNIFYRIFFTPKSERLCFHTKIPLLVLHSEK
ncbi:MAG: universal stress protein [Bacteroidota bacterium]